MFRSFGTLVARTWPAWLVVWLALLVAAWLAAPRWDDVAQDQELGLLPADSPSRVSEAIFRQAFPDEQTTANIVLVLEREEGSTSLAQVKQFIGDVLEPRLREIAERAGGFARASSPSDGPLFSDTPVAPRPTESRSIIARVRTPNAPGVGALLSSADGRAALVVVELTMEFMSRRNWPVIGQVEELLRVLRTEGRMPAGVRVELTGSAVIGRDNTQAQLRSARATELLTVVLVIVLLVLIYRAPLLALIPLATVYVAVQLGLGILAFLAEREIITLFQGVQIYLTILAYGAGVDYCLFLMARYREELERGADPSQAIVDAIGHVGAALAASAATVICGIGMMIFAEFGKFRQAGFAIPLGLVLVLGASLTFTPALLLLAGRFAFWPRYPETKGERKPEREARGGWERLAQLVSRRPGALWLSAVGVMIPFGVVGLLFSGRMTYNLIGNLPADAPGVAGLRTLQAHFPAGLVSPTTVLVINPDVDFDARQGRALVERITKQLRDRREELGLADFRSLAAPLGVTEVTERAFTQVDMPENVVREAIEREARERYLTDMGERKEIGTRLEFILEDSPFAQSAMKRLGDLEATIRESLPPEFRDGTRIYLLGTTAGLRDLSAVLDRDRTRIELLALVGVFLILVLLLRTILISFYLILSVLFSYYVTLGVAFVVFWALDPSGFTGIDWRVGIFLFTILIAVGEDYNIFLMARVEEEQRRLDPVRGVLEALRRTGPIISSCGIIMAGTFASLMAGSLTEMKQLGFALAFGVLLDTFVVRPILVPAFLVLWHRRFRPAA